jgi:hypothetical protein
LERRRWHAVVNLALRRCLVSTELNQLPFELSHKEELPPGRMSRAQLLKVIVWQYEDYLKDCGGSYDVKDFREHCQPFYLNSFRIKDLELDCDGSPKWYGRFSYAHRQIAAEYNYYHASCGIFVQGGS